MIEASSTAEQLVVEMYLQACQLASQAHYSAELHQEAIAHALSHSAIPFKDIRKIVAYSKDDWVQDLLEVTQDLKNVLANSSKNFVRFLNRSRMHFGGAHCASLAHSDHHKPAKKVLEMYGKRNFEWSEGTEDYFISTIYPNSAYMMGLTKGNAVLLNKATLLSCAHVFQDEDSDRIFQIRCFSNGFGEYGIVRTTKNDLFEEEDVAFSEVIYFSDENVREIEVGLPSELLFQDFVPIQCVQVGVLFDPDNFVETFYTSEGFIERNLYADEKDTRLEDEMGLLVHSCYGLGGTSGSPIWSGKGELLGIHNAWNSEGRNISMIVHDDDEDNVFVQHDECRVVKQYERRAVSAHAIAILREQWTANKGKAFRKAEKQRTKENLIFTKL